MSKEPEAAAPVFLHLFPGMPFYRMAGRNQPFLQ